MATRKLVWWKSVSAPKKSMIGFKPTMMPTKKPSAPKTNGGVMRKIRGSIMEWNKRIIRNDTKRALRKSK